MKILAFGASSSRNSINKKLAAYAASLVDGAQVDLLDLNDFEMPIYSIDKEQESGLPQLAHDFKARLAAADGVIISFAEHNGSYSAAFKNVYDWMSRVEKEIWMNKPMLLLATSPGARGGQSVLENALREFPHRKANIVGHFSLPSFGQNMTDGGISDEDLLSGLKTELAKLKEAIA